MRRQYLASLLLVLLAAAFEAQAHQSGAAYLRLIVVQNRITVELDLSLRDMAILLGLPGAETLEQDFAQIAEHEPTLLARVRDGLEVRNDAKPCALRPAPQALSRLAEPSYAQIRFAAECPDTVEHLGFGYRLLFAQDPNHRVFVAVSELGHTHSAVLTAEEPQLEMQVRPDSAAYHFVTYLREGVHHIATGVDHLLFLIALLLPASLARRGREWLPQESVRLVLTEVLKVVTAFTLAHSLTLALAVFGWIHLPSRQVEAAIAASVLLAAFNNLQGFMRGRAWLLGFGFGLIHGLGFASALDILGLPQSARGIALFAFNLGVELGQLVVVAAVLPLLLALRRSRHYRLVMVDLPSLLIAWIAAVWLFERSTGLALLR